MLSQTQDAAGGPEPDSADQWEEPAAANQDVAEAGPEQAEEAEQPEIDITINNVVSMFNTRCHLVLKRIATEGMNVEYKPGTGRVRQGFLHAFVYVFDFFRPCFKSVVD